MVSFWSPNLYYTTLAGIEDCSPSPVPKYLSKQLEYLNEHEKLIQSYVPQLTQTHNTHAIRILHEQLYLLKVRV